MSCEENVLKMKMIGTPLPEEKINFELHLRYPEDSPPLPTLEQLGKGLPQRRKYYTHEEYRKLYSAAPKDIERVKEFADKYGLNVEAVDPVLRLMSLSGTIEAVSGAFNIRPAFYRGSDYVLYGTGYIFFGHRGRVEIPPELDAVVDYIFGLECCPIAKKLQPDCKPEELSGSVDAMYCKINKPRKNEKSSNQQNSAETAWYPNELAAIYNFPTGVSSGKGQSVAILEFMGGFRQEALERYFRDYIKIEMPAIESIEVGSGKNSPGDPSDPTDPNNTADMEVYLDIEVVASIASGAKVNVYFGPQWIMGYVDYAAFWKTLACAVHDAERKNTVISVSWGWTEDLVCDEGKALINQVLQEAASMNITVCTSSGDDGARCLMSDGSRHVIFPASSPYALSCGGTKLDMESGKRHEIVWNQSDYQCAGGGGYSGFFSRPPYQQELRGEDTIKRGCPDVAANAAVGSYMIMRHQDAEPSPLGGGTSAAAPLWAALIAVINGALGAPVGLLNPFMYRVGKLGRIFNTVTEGNNSMKENIKYKLPAVHGYDAGIAWSPCTGWGSPDGEKLLKSIQISTEYYLL